LVFPTEIATSTFTSFLGTVYGQTITMAIYVLQYTWPYLLGAGVLWFFYHVAKSAFRGN